ncbi:MAG TPA: UDP-N-acetylglucosamine--N-acetylmuramyl-(pentapeptide) pyrophosphoryl-undecaprenol N-acetylglucosamine transferase [Dehalococcoidia bacterium]|nr:UDP-N-acetylglucosamine--N-acetylmuramyl-(pentapeptide) pyrophosphoryl-undecaprenol N-acetylglucosamine transferase [Dehalococcoidia bacterium]
MRIVLTGGGTAGHVFPALSVATALREECGRLGLPLDLLYLGLRTGPEARIAPQHGVPFAAVSARPLRGRNPIAMLRALFSIAWGTLRARSLLRGSAGVLATGGYVTVPVALAARSRRTPLVVYLPDVEPGWAVRLTSRLARRIATTTDRGLAHLPRGKAEATGYPVRPEFRKDSRDVARSMLGIEDGERVLLVAGATQGARSLNEAVAARLEDYLRLARVIHVCGPAHEEAFKAQRDRLPIELRGRYTVDGFRDDMPRLMIAADLAVLRAGASVLGELPAARLPAILVPGPFAGAHQAHNARYLADAGAAAMLDDDELVRLFGLVESLLTDDERRAAMRVRLAQLDRPNAARDIACIVLQEAGEEP